MDPLSYAKIVASNIRAVRGRKGLEQQDVADRMSALGFSSWRLRQTVSSLEKGRRRVTAEELLALSVVLDTSVPVLMAPSPDDTSVRFGEGATVSSGFVYRLIKGLNDGEVQWDANTPVFVGPASGAAIAAGRPKPKWPPDGTPMAFGNAEAMRQQADLLRQVADLSERLARYEEAV
jgi:transcriptional regulator with XRE-family HTH domain